MQWTFQLHSQSFDVITCSLFIRDYPRSIESSLSTMIADELRYMKTRLKPWNDRGHHLLDSCILILSPNVTRSMITNKISCNLLFIFLLFVGKHGKSETCLNFPMMGDDQWWFLKILTRGALRTTTPIVWVWSSCNHAHISKDGNMII